MEEKIESINESLHKVKHMEQVEQAKIKEKRDYDMTVAAMEKALREETTSLEKLHNEITSMQRKIDKLCGEIAVAQEKRTARSEQIAAGNEKNEKLRIEIDKGIGEVWQTRSSVCDEIHGLSDACDLSVLLKNRPLPQSSPRPQPSTPVEELDVSDRLEEANKRKEYFEAERNRLKEESEVGDEFVRLRNALRYTKERIAALKQVRTDRY